MSANSPLNGLIIGIYQKNEIMNLITINEDERGKYIEVFKIPGVGQISYATSRPGAVRGNHYHKRKKEKFCVIEGEAKIRLRNRENNEAKEYLISGDEPEVIDVPINWTHNVQNIGKDELKLLIWANEIFNPDDRDTYAEPI